MKYFCGIDIGSVGTKVVFIDEECTVAASSSGISMPDPAKAYTKCLGECLNVLGCSTEEIAGIVSVGYGKKLVTESSKNMSEITALARGVRFLNPQAGFIIDAGGEDSKAVLTDENGMMVDFAMNDKCSAGTGRFIETTSAILEIPLDRLSESAGSADKKLSLSSTCTVFAISEINSLLSQNEKKENIASAIIDSICSRLASLANSVGIERGVAFTGGVAQIRIMQQRLSAVLGRELFVSQQPQLVTALGAALLAKDFYGKLA